MKFSLALIGLLALAAVPAHAAAGHSFCDGSDDISLGFVGIDGPILGDTNGEQVCVGDGVYQVTVSPAPAGIGYVVTVCYGVGVTANPCNETAGNQVILGQTGVSILCASLVSACLWVDGAPL